MMIPMKIFIFILSVTSSLSQEYMLECSLSLISLRHGTANQLQTTSEQVIRYSCNHGYELIGSSTQTCINGTWSPPIPPVCRRYPKVIQPCSTDQQVLHGHIHFRLEDRGYHHVSKDTTGSLICDSGYGYASGKTFQTRFVLVCGQDGILRTSVDSDNLNLCIHRDCPDPPELPKAMYRFNKDSPIVGEGMQVEYICSIGYQLLDPDDATLTCHNGQWEGPVPTCVLKTSCDAPSFIRNGKWSVRSKDKSGMNYEVAGAVSYSKFNVGTVLIYSCDPGYKLEGPRILQCSASQIWSRAPPVCIPETEQIWYCPHFGTIKNGFCKCMGQDTADLQLCMPFHRDTRIECTCLLGYALQGVSVLTCTHRAGLNIGVWNWDVPTCVKRYAPASDGENDIGMLPDGHDEGEAGKGYNSGDIHDSRTKVSSLVIVVTTACSVLGILLLIMVVVIFRRKKPRPAIFQQGSTPPPYARVHNTVMDEHDRLALMAYADASRVHLPSYEEAVQFDRPGGHIGVGARPSSIMDRSVSPTTSEYQRLPNVLVRSNIHHPNLAGDGNNNINNNNNNNTTNNRHSIITTSTMNRDGLSEIFGSVDTVNVSMSDASTAVTIETYDSGTSNRSMVSQRATAGSLNSSEDHLANDDAPLLETNSQREMDVVSLSSNPSRTSKEE